MTIFLLTVSGCVVSESRYLQQVSANQRLQQDVKATRNDYYSLIARNATLQTKVTLLTTELDMSKAEQSRLETRVQNTLKDISASQEESLHRTHDLRQSINDLENENARLRLQILRLQKERENKARQTNMIYGQLLNIMRDEIASGKVTITELTGKVTIGISDSLLFNPGGSDMSPNGLLLMSKITELLKTLNDKKFNINSYNYAIDGKTEQDKARWELSVIRGMNIISYIQGKGIDPLLLTASEITTYTPTQTDKNGIENKEFAIIILPNDL